MNIRFINLKKEFWKGHGKLRQKRISKRRKKSGSKLRGNQRLKPHRKIRPKIGIGNDVISCIVSYVITNVVSYVVSKTFLLNL